MLQHTIKSIVRQLWRSPLFTTIHLLGLSIGLCAVLIIFLYIRQELSYDTTHQHAANVYRVAQISERQGEMDYSAGSPYVMPDALREEIPDLEAVSGLHFQGSGVVRVPGKDFQKVDAVVFADQHLLELFDYTFMGPTKASVLAEPNKVLLSVSTSERLFGIADATGQTLTLDGAYELTVGGVFADQNQSNIQPELLVSLESLPQILHGFDRSSWGLSIGGVTYVRLPEGQEPAQYAASLAGFVDKYMNGEEEGNKNTIYLQPVQEIHFDTRFEDYTNVPTSSISYLWVAGGIGLLILLMACFNFVNLSLAQNLAKRQVIGMQKILGAKSQQIWLQGWGQALTLALIALIMGGVMLQWALPQAELMLERNFNFAGIRDTGVWGFVLAIVLFVSLLAGGYPAWVSASKRPLEALSNSKVVSNRSQGRLRHGIVLAQFVITLLMICSALTVSRQLNFLKDKDLGFRQDAILQLSLGEPGLDEQARSAWKRIAGVEEVSFSLGAPTSNNHLNSDYYPKGKDPQHASTEMGLKTVDENYANTYDLKVLAGAFLDAKDAHLMENAFEGDIKEWPVVVNETLVSDLGYATPEEAIGKRIMLGINNIEAHIKGVVADFHTHSLHEAVQPTVMAQLSPLYYEVGLKIAPNKIRSVLAQLETSWKSLYPDHFFDYEFLDEALAEQYLQEDRIGTMLQGFAGLAIMIACLGLFGLTAIMVQHRRKEIGLRKVLGASVRSIWGLLSSDMVKLIGIAVIIAGPLAWWLMQQWLANFVYRVDMSISTIAIAGLALVLIALTAVSGLAIKAALSNPVEALRSE